MVGVLVFGGFGRPPWRRLWWSVDERMARRTMLPWSMLEHIAVDAGEAQNSSTVFMLNLLGERLGDC